MVLKLPPTPHLPGRTPRPARDVFAPCLAGLHPGMDAEALSRSAAFRAGQEAFARGYFWEAHEFWEAVWHLLPPAGAERHLMRGLIQLANAGLKAGMGRGKASGRILGLADAALAEAYLGGRVSVMGMTRGDVESLRNYLRLDGGKAV